MYSIDLFVQNYFLTARTPIFTRVMYILTSFFDATDTVSIVRFLIIVLCFAALIYWIRNKRLVALFVLALLCGAIVSNLLKYFFDISRPLGAAIIVIGKSFPSYHATMATIFFTMLMYIFDSHFGRLGRIILNSTCVAGIILISFSRVYLGVHWLSDVLGGIVLGILVSYVSIRIFKYPFKP